jgi:hypothetical protein
MGNMRQELHFCQSKHTPVTPHQTLLADMQTLLSMFSVRISATSHTVADRAVIIPKSLNANHSKCNCINKNATKNDVKFSENIGKPWLVSCHDTNSNKRYNETVLLPPPRKFISVNEKYKCKVEWQRIIYFFWQYTDFSISVIQLKIFSFYATTKIFPFFFHSPINLFCLKKKKKPACIRETIQR